MEKIVYNFTEDCKIGIEQIDDEHQKLFAIINEAVEALHNPEIACDSVRSLVLALRHYARTHFLHEEAYMEKINDPEYAIQKKEHDLFTSKVNSIDLDNINKEGTNEIVDLLTYLSIWLYRHILGSDTLIGKLKSVNESDIEFTSEYITGIEEIDNQHRRLFEIIKKANDLLKKEYTHDKYDEIIEVINELKDYTKQHFADEEAYMESINYNGLEIQQMAHISFIDKLNDIDMLDLEDNQQGYLVELMDFLLSWLVYHILKLDKKIPSK